jgi:hypothetical protein
MMNDHQPTLRAAAESEAAEARPDAALAGREAAAEARELALLEQTEALEARELGLRDQEAIAVAREETLDAWEAGLAEKEHNNTMKAKDLETEAADLGVARTRLAGERENADRQQREAHAVLARRHAEVEERARKVSEREIEADAGFAAHNQAALAELERRRAGVLTEIAGLDTHLAAERKRRAAALETALSDERQTRQDALEADLRTRRAQAASEEQEAAESARRSRTREREEHVAARGAEREEHVAAMGRERQAFETERDREREERARERVALDTREGELRLERTRVGWREQELQAERAEIEQGAERRAADRVAALERELEHLREDYARAADGRNALERRLQGYEELMDRFDGVPEEVLRRLDDAKTRISALQEELLARPAAAERERLVELQAEQRAWGDERLRQLTELHQLRAERARWHLGVGELESRRDLQEIAERRLAAVKAETERYAEEVKRLRALYERPEERAARVGAIEEPWRKDPVRAAEDPNLTEVAWLDRIIEGAAASGMQFPRRLVYAFHTSLKSAELSPITVLAGVSGTGKSELPRLYSRFGGFAFLSLPVQPNWDSPQSLFGFFNSVDNRFNATTLLRGLAQSQFSPDADHPHGFADRPLLVLLDEMNLAYVEQYFSDILSKLEQRRGETADVAIDLDLGAGMAPYSLRLGRNVMWVGTMNEDETTKALSDKVIDRSNLLYFPRPRTLHSRTDMTLGREAPLLSMKTWSSWIRTGSVLDAPAMDRLRTALERINGHLEHVGRALGHRVWQSVAAYVSNHPDVLVAKAAADDDALRRATARAFEDQLVQKVMPKLRGIETSGNAKRACLDPISKELADPDLGLSLSEDFQIACRVGNGAFVWNSARYLEGTG